MYMSVIDCTLISFLCPGSYESLIIKGWFSFALQCGEVKEVRLVRNRAGRSKRFAYIEYCNEVTTGQLHVYTAFESRTIQSQSTVPVQTGQSILCRLFHFISVV